MPSGKFQMMISPYARLTQPPPTPSLVRRGVSTTGIAGEIPRLSQEGLGVVVRKVSNDLFQMAVMLTFTKF